MTVRMGVGVLAEVLMRVVFNLSKSTPAAS
jgi:hypothetical protein